MSAFHSLLTLGTERQHWAYCGIRALDPWPSPLGFPGSKGDCGFVPIVNVDDMTRFKRQLNATPKVIVFFHRRGIIIENAKVTSRDTFPNEDPHSFYGDRLVRIINSEPENQLSQIAWLQTLTGFTGRYPEGVRRLAMVFFPVF